MRVFTFDIRRFAKSGNSTLKFIGTFWGSLFFKKSSDKTTAQVSALTTMLAGTVSIVEDVYAIREENSKDNPSKVVIASKAEDFISNLASLTNAFQKLNGGKNSFILSVISSAVGLASNLILGMDGLDEEEVEKINKSYVGLVQVSGAEIIKKFFSAGLADKLIKMPTNQILEIPGIREELGKQFTKGSGPLGLIFAAITGVLNGANKYDNNLKKYTDDGIPEDIAKHDARIDALATFIHDTASSYAKGFDDTVFSWIMWATGKENIFYEDKNYVEVIADQFKTLNYKNSGLADDDPILISSENKFYTYGDNGNDSIENVASNVTIWGGHDNDTIWSLKNDSKIPQKNSIFGGPGNDLIYVEDKLSTIYGGKGADSVFVLGTKNLVYGDAGNDTLISAGTKNNIYGDSGSDSIILYAGATENNVTGGLGNDSIFIDPANKKNKFFYSTGDGNDTIEGFGATDSLSISGKYSTVKSGSDFKVIVGSGSILLVDAADKKIHINNNVFNDDSESYGTFTPIELPSLPSVPEYPLVSGTSGDDTIENSRSNILINADNGNNKIWNGADNVTINSGKGNDSILSTNWIDNVSISGGYGNDFITSELTGFGTINGDAGNDTIYSNGHDVKIFGDKGNDFITNEESWRVTINAGEGNDTIWNSSWNRYSTINGGTGTYSTQLSGDDIIVTVGKGKITLQGAGYLSQPNIDGVYNDPTLLTVTNSTKSPVTVGSAVKTVDASSRTKAVKITGNKLANTIYSGAGKDSLVGNAGNDKLFGGAGNDSLAGGAGKDTLSGDSGDDIIFGEAGNDCMLGGKGNDTLWGGKGNDSLWGNAGADKFIYESGDGKDVIFGFDNKDTLTFDNIEFTTSYSKKNKSVSFNMSGGSVTLKDFTATTFHINSDVYKISGSKFKKQ